MTGQQSQVEHWEESGSPNPDRGRRAALLPKCVFVCWVMLRLGGGWGWVGLDAPRAEEPGTLGLAMAAQRSSEL